jgi:predicted RNA-binding protein with RPS1 domain
MQAVMPMKHVVIDGSNIATEGRDTPSLAQLDEAVRAFIEEYAPDVVTVVVDATFPNRIDVEERRTYEDAVAANELVTPPAGAIGRGDAFVLQIARKADAAILSNDSFQEFHGDYPWLFEPGRLIGGKPVPHVGWVFMERVPVRGPASRRSVSEARKAIKSVKATKASKATKATKATKAAKADKAPARVQTGVPRRGRSELAVTGDGTTGPAQAGTAPGAAASTEGASGDGRGEATARTAKDVSPYNEALPFIEFIADHPVGSEVEATVERFSSHGAYVLSGDARGYVPLRNLAQPAPRSAREVLNLGDKRRFLVIAIDPPRRGIDLALPGVVDVPAGGVAPVEEQVIEALGMTDVSAAGQAPAAKKAKAAARRTSTKRTATTRAAAKQAAAPKRTAKQAPVKAPVARKAKARAKASAATNTAAKTSAATKAAAKASAPRKAPARASAAKKAPAKASARKASGSPGATKGASTRKTSTKITTKAGTATKSPRR